MCPVPEVGERMSRQAMPEGSCGLEGGLGWQQLDWRGYQALDVGAEEREDPLARFALDVVVSAGLAPNRSVPDLRDPACLALAPSTPLPSVTVIITYRNEPRSTLLRTLVSVLERSPEDVLAEIILVDDNNDDQEVGLELAKVGKVRLVRNEEREGLIRSRVVAAKLAIGKVLVFLDSHCEVQPGWLPPLLASVTRDRTTIASPIIDNINFLTFELEAVSAFLRGGFDWHLDFFWEWLPAADRARKARDPTSPVATPAIAGGLFAVQREWFAELGWYDEGMDVWGGENIEVSLRAWQCGGRLEIVPCSRVGHVYKQRTPYSYPGGSRATVACNSWRAAAVWLDQYQALHTRRGPGGRSCGEVAGRRALRERLGCRDFSWFLANVYPELQVPGEGDQAFGSVHLGGEPWTRCLDPAAHPGERSVGAAPCLQSHHVQQYRHTKGGHLRQDDFCLTAVEVQVGALVEQRLCREGEERQGWERVVPGAKVRRRTELGGFLYRLVGREVCLDTGDMLGRGLRVMRCTMGAAEQRLRMTYHAPGT